MRSTTVQWPETILGCPLVAAYGGNVRQTQTRSSINDGPSYFAILQHEELRQYDLQFAWSQFQLSQWEAFHDTTLLFGMRWFMMDQLYGNQMVPMYCHLKEGYKLGALVQSKDLLSVSFSVEAFYRGS